MRMHRLLPVIAMFAVVCQPCRAEEPRALRSVAEIRELRKLSFTAERPLSLTGVVTLVDHGLNLLLLQDDTGAVALHPDTPGFTAEPMATAAQPLWCGEHRRFLKAARPGLTE